MEPKEATPQQNPQRQELKTAYLQRIQTTPPEVLAEQLTDEEIKRRKELKELESLTTVDHLVRSVANHHHFLELLSREVEATKRMPEPSSFLLGLDLDRFKDTNKVLGHPTADTLLKDVGKILTDSIRDEDSAGRTGGDEFSIIVRRTNLDVATAIAMRIQHAVVNQLQKSFNRPDFTQTISIGLCLIPKDATVEWVRDIADAALYTVKNSGRNQIAIGSINPDTNSIETSIIPFESSTTFEHT